MHWPLRELVARQANVSWRGWADWKPSTRPGRLWKQLQQPRLWNSTSCHWFVSPLSPYLSCAVLGSLNKCSICSKYFGCTIVCASTSCILILPSPEVSLPSGGSFSIPGKSLVNSHQLIFGPFPFHWNGYLPHLVVLCFINSVVLHCSYLCSLCVFQHLLKFLVLFIIRFSTGESGCPCHKIWRQLSNGCASTLGKE